MNRIELLRILAWIWAAFGIYWWVVAGFRSRPEHTAEPSSRRVLRLFILLVTFTLLFARWTAVGPLGWRMFGQTAGTRYLGCGLAMTGIAVALWARIHLGQFWSDKVVLKVDHQLIRTGPYAHLRHPIYSGVLLGVAGTAIVLDEFRGGLAFVILLVNYWIKAKGEDRILALAFAGQFAEHKSHAGFLLPRLRR
jgi:protein-S-isoprenylcysteine O-methyltransferase Ste14